MYSKCCVDHYKLRIILNCGNNYETYYNNIDVVIQFQECTIIQVIASLAISTSMYNVITQKLSNGTMCTVMGNYLNLTNQTMNMTISDDDI